MPQLDRKATSVFAGKVVRKDLVRKVKVGANVPVFVLEYLLGKYCATDDPAAIDAGLRVVNTTLTENFVRPDEANAVQSRVKDKGQYALIDKIKVRYLSDDDKHWAELVLFMPMPDVIREDMAFIDRLHYYVPDWEIPKMRVEFFTDHYGFVVDDLAEALRDLRKHNFTEIIDRHFSLGSHLHQFEIDGERYGDPELLDDGFEDFHCIDSTVTKINEIVPKDGKRFGFLHEYDFGDGWEHEVVFECCLRAEKGQRYPVCVEGERSCPPEDGGASGGMRNSLKLWPIRNTNGTMISWSGPGRSIQKASTLGRPRRRCVGDCRIGGSFDEQEDAEVRHRPRRRCRKLAEQRRTPRRRE